MAKRKNPLPARRSGAVAALDPGSLLRDVTDLIRQAREFTATAVNSALVQLYWQIGQRIRTEVLKEQRAGYGEEICSTLSSELAREFGSGFSRQNLNRMIQFAEVFPNADVVAALSRTLGWSHFVEIIYLKNDLQRDFYAEMCRVERWSVRTLRQRIGAIRTGKLESIDNYLITNREEGIISFDESVRRLLKAGKIAREVAERNVRELAVLNRYKWDSSR